MKPFRLLLLTLLALSFSHLHATTWDEPWMEDVIKDAESFVLARVKSYDEHKGVTIEVTKTLAGTPLKGKVEITSFSLLDLCSSSAGHGPEFHFKGADSCYFFIRKVKGKYCIATPTTGFSVSFEGSVLATYRHSYHQAKVPVAIYEKTMTAIFNHYHGLPWDQAYMEQFINQNLSLKPAGYGPDEIETFFTQHVALESIYHLRLEGHYEQLIPFLHHNENWHNQVSAARALIAYNSEACKTQLVAMIADTSVMDFPKTMCVLSLTEFKPTELKETLTALIPTSSTEGGGFGGNIMDPRICTHFPSVRSALEKLVAQL